MRSAPARRARLAPLGLVLGLALTGCGANFQAQTYQERPTSDGTNTAVGAIAVRNANILPPEGRDLVEAGEDALVGLVLTNDGPEDDRLVEVSSPDAASAQIVEGDELEPVDTIELGRLTTVGTRYGIVLEGLKEDLRTGQYAELTLVFERNGEVTLQVPVATTGVNDQKDREHSENFHPIGEDEHSAEGAEEAQEGGGPAEAGEETQDEQAGEGSE